MNIMEIETADHMITMQVVTPPQLTIQAAYEPASLVVESRGVKGNTGNTGPQGQRGSDGAANIPDTLDGGNF